MLVRFHRLAGHELRDAAAHYEAAVLDLGFEFTRAVLQATRVIGEHPEIAQMVDAEALLGVRRFVIRRFPYLLVYHLRDGVVEILAVAHTKRQPRYWVRRIHRH